MVKINYEDKDRCQFECRKDDDWNPGTCICKNDKCLGISLANQKLHVIKEP